MPDHDLCVHEQYGKTALTGDHFSNAMHQGIQSSGNELMGS